MNSKRIVTFGELLLRFSKFEHRRFTQTEVLRGNFGGSEANVAISLATLGDDVEYVTRLPKGQIGQAALMMLREYNLRTSHVLCDGDRMGTYYFEGAAGLRNSSVVYDRTHILDSEIVGPGSRKINPFDHILVSSLIKISVFHTLRPLIRFSLIIV